MVALQPPADASSLLLHSPLLLLCLDFQVLPRSKCWCPVRQCILNQKARITKSNHRLNQPACVHMSRSFNSLPFCSLGILQHVFFLSLFLEQCCLFSCGTTISSVSLNQATLPPYTPIHPSSFPTGNYVAEEVKAEPSKSLISHLSPWACGSKRRQRKKRKRQSEKILTTKMPVQTTTSRLRKPYDLD